jgi:hypothetical protein
MSVVAQSIKYELHNFIGGKLAPTKARTLDVYDPSVGAVISQVPLSAASDVDAAVRAAQAALPAWAAMPVKERVQIFFRYRNLLEQNIDELSALVTEENGKIASEARAEVLKSMELTEYACSLPQITAGEVMEVSRGVECRIEKFPVGVVASITPFNFPNMVPNWTIPNAIALGNCMILKPSELVPLSANRIAELAGWCVECRARRTGSRRSHLRSSGHRCGVVRGIDSRRQDRLSSCDVEPEARAVSGRRQEPSHRAARCECRNGIQQHHCVDVGLRGPALHGRVRHGCGQ